MPLLTWRVTVAGGAAVVEDDLPFAVSLPPPYGIVGAGTLAGGVAHRAGRHGESAGIEHLDRLGRPRERSLRAFEIGLPALRDLFGATRHPGRRRGCGPRP